MSTNWLLDVDPAPALLVLPRAAASLDEAHAAIELWEHYSGKTLDDAQRLTVQVLMAQDKANRWAASTTGRCMPRQQGKGDEIEVVELWGLVQRAEAILHTVHDAVLLASQAQQRLLAVLEAHADLRRLVKRKWLGTGQQMTELRNGGTIWYRTRTNGGGRGVDDIDRLVVDEAQHAQEDHLAALTPTMLANENAQLNALGSAGIDGKSAWWWRMRIRALSADPAGLGWVEHGAERVHLDEAGVPVQDPVDVTDRSLWPGANPSLITHRGQGMDFFEEQFQRLDPRSFAREHLGVWDPPPIEDDASILPLERWRAKAKKVQRKKQIAYAVDAAPDLTSAAIGVSDGRSVVVVEHHPGSGWLPAALAGRLVSQPGPVYLDPRGPAGALLTGLQGHGIQWVEITPAQHAQACGGLLGALLDDGESFFHDDQPALNAAVAGASRRPYGDAWAWNRKSASVDISPLVAVTIARWAALQKSYSGPLVAVT